MPSPARSTRGDERRLSVRTLAIASIASATAAIVTSLFWRGGTPVAAAITPVIVALVSEMLHRPTTVIAERLTVERAALPQRDRRGLGRSEPARPQPERERAAKDLDAVRTLRRDLPGTHPPSERPGRVAGPGDIGDVSVYRRSPARKRRLLPVKPIAIMAALAFVIGTAIVTVPELVAGRSIGSGDRQFSVLGGSRSADSDRQTESREEEAPRQTQPEQQPEQQSEQPAPQDQQAPPASPAPEALEPQETTTTPETETQTETTPTAPTP